MRYFALTVFLVCSFTATGCMTSPVFVGTEKTPIQAPSAPPEPVEESFVARLHVSSPQATYRSDESISIGVVIETGTFDLLVSHATVESEGLLPALVVTDQNGAVVDPDSPVAYGSEMKELVRDGKKVECVKGVRLLSGTGRMVVIEDIRNHYALTPGVYTLQVSLDLNIYKETVTAESIPIHDAEQRIGRVRAKPRIAAHTREKHIAGLESAIDALEIQAQELDEIYLPLDSLRGVVTLKSNVITLHIQGPS